MEQKEEKLTEATCDAFYHIGLVRTKLYEDLPLDAKELADFRSELSNASNAIDDAMGIIDELTAPERTREDEYDS